jgi:DNA-binding NarL/FixJ family response regulator/AraC-like DNA-binding protein
MHKILIVEDDVMYRYAVKSLIDCSDGALSFLPEAINGKHALAIMETERPDIVITDISMAEMNGVELIKTVKASWPEIKILALSAYDDFGFVKDALKNGAEDYILKYELEEADLNAVVRSLGDKIDSERRERSRDEYILENREAIVEDFFRKTILGETRDAREIERNLKRLFPYRDRALFSVAVFAILGDSPVSSRDSVSVGNALEALAAENPRYRFVRLPQKGLFAALVDLAGMGDDGTVRTGMETLTRKILRRVESASGERVCIAVSSPVSDCGRLADCFREAEKLLEGRFYFDGSRVFLPVPGECASNSGTLRPFVDAILSALESGVAEGVAGATKALFGALAERKPDLSLLDETISDLVGGFHAAAARKGMDFAGITGMERRPLRACEIAASIGRLENVLSSWFAAFLAADRQPSASCRREVLAVMDYVRRNYRSEIQLAAIAGSLRLSPNYLCGLFKKETGMRIFEYLHRVRIEEAIRLLKTTGLKVYEISEKVGFHTVPYFCRTFREITGRSLSAFRKHPG